MADEKISALVSGSPVTSPTGAIGFGVVQSGTSKGLTLAQVMTFVNTAPVWAAGTATAGTWPTFTSGTLLTTPVAGTWEYDGKALYFTDGTGRGVTPSVSYMVLNTAYITASGSTSLQKLFNIGANGRVAVAANTTYFFECDFSLSSLSATPGTVTFGLQLTTAVISGISMEVVATKAGNPGMPEMTLWAGASGGALVTAGIGQSAVVRVRGWFTTTTAGFVTPSFAISVAAAAVVNAGSRFMMWSAGSDASTNVGPWS